MCEYDRHLNRLRLWLHSIDLQSCSPIELKNKAELANLVKIHGNPNNEGILNAALVGGGFSLQILDQPTSL